VAFFKVSQSGKNRYKPLHKTPKAWRYRWTNRIP